MVNAEIQICKLKELNMRILNFKNYIFFIVSLFICTSGMATSEIEEYRGAYDSDWVSITGEVSGITGERFTLDFDKGDILVEMDDWDMFEEIKLITIGDRVTVSGRLDNSLYEKKTIEALRVYSHNNNSYYYASSIDDEGDIHTYDVHVTVALPESTVITVSGTVSKVDGREFTLDTGKYNVIIDTDDMSYNPMDQYGFQKVDKGDKLHITGYVDYGFFEKNEIKAKIIEKIFTSRS